MRISTTDMKADIPTSWNPPYFYEGLYEQEERNRIIRRYGMPNQMIEVRDLKPDERLSDYLWQFQLSIERFT
jgi:hypothetical protein